MFVEGQVSGLNLPFNLLQNQGDRRASKGNSRPENDIHRAPVKVWNAAKMVIPLIVRASSAEPRTAMERRAVMTWAQRLKRVFNIDIETCKKSLPRLD